MKKQNGAIRDEKLKKNEIKVTVIATGFPEPHTGNEKTTFVRTPMHSRPQVAEEQEAVAEEPRGRIFNSLSTPRKPEPEPMSDINTPTINSTPKAPEMPRRDPKPVDPIDEEDNDDWGAVPAFLRRSKLK